MTDNFKMCLELTEELEKHKKRINQYKQKLKAKEQECEELKKQIKYEFDETLLQYSNELDRLKAENGELKKNYFTVIQQRNKAEQTLIEIKELVQSDYCTEIGSCEFCAEIGNCLNRKILHKISECEGNNE